MCVCTRMCVCVCVCVCVFVCVLVSVRSFSYSAEFLCCRVYLLTRRPVRHCCHGSVLRSAACSASCHPSHTHTHTHTLTHWLIVSGWGYNAVTLSKQIHLVGEHLIIKIHQNTTSYCYFVDVLVSYDRDRPKHQQSKNNCFCFDEFFNRRWCDTAVG